VEDPDLFEPRAEAPSQPARRGPAPHKRPPTHPLPNRGRGHWRIGGRLSWIAGLVLALSAFMSWYSGSSLEGPTLSIIGWNSGTLGKLVFFTGLAVVLLAVLGELGVTLPPSIPESLVVVTLGTLGTIFVLIRIISIPDTFADTSRRGIGLWIGLVAGVAVIVSGLLRASDEL
jgi:hypothetical protein